MTDQEPRTWTFGEPGSDTGAAAPLREFAGDIKHSPGRLGNDYLRTLGAEYTQAELGSSDLRAVDARSDDNGQAS